MGLYRTAKENYQITILQTPLDFSKQLFNCLFDVSNEITDSVNMWHQF